MLPKTVADSINKILALSVVSIRSLKEQIKSFDKTIEQQLQVVPNTLTSVKGIDLVYSAGIIAEVGDIRRFPNHAVLVNMQGLPGLSTNPEIMRLKTRDLLIPAIDSLNTT